MQPSAPRGLRREGKRPVPGVVLGTCSPMQPCRRCRPCKWTRLLTNTDLMAVKTAIIPGNGAGNVHKCNWYGWLHQKLHSPPAVTCSLRNMPDPVTARESIWLPFMRDTLECDQSTIIIGHSSGAAAAMRYAEQTKVAGLVLVSAYTTDQGDATEAASGYFNRPWQWQSIKDNAGFILQFASDDDPFLPLEEQLEVAENLNAQLFRFPDRNHFMDRQQPELHAAVVERIQALLARQQTATAAP